MITKKQKYKSVVLALAAACTLFMIAVTMTGCVSGSPGADSEENFENAENGKYSIIDQDKYDGPLMEVRDNETGLFGAVDGKGKFAIKCEYEMIVCHGDDIYEIKKDGNYGLVDEKGKQILPCSFSEIKLPNYSDIDEKFVDYMVLAMDDKGKYGYYSLNDGSELIKPQFEDAKTFSEIDRAPVMINGSWGVIDRNGEWTVPAKYQIDEVDVWHGQGVITVEDKEGNRQVITTDGNKVVAFGEGSDIPRYNTMSAMKKGEAYTIVEIYEDPAAVIGEGKSCVLDSKGNFVIPMGDEYIDCYAGNLFIVGDIDEGQPRIIDCEGNEILKGKYNIDEDCCVSIEEDHTNCLIVKGSKSGKHGRLDLDGNEIIPCKYDYLENVYYDKKTDKGLWMFARKYGEKIGLVNEKGEEIMEPKYDTINEFHDGVATVLNDGKIGSINQKGEELAPCKYVLDKEIALGEGDVPYNLIPVTKDGKNYAFVDDKCQLLTDFKYSAYRSTFPKKDNRKMESIPWVYMKTSLIVKDGEKGYGIIGPEGKEITPCTLHKVIGETNGGLFLVVENKGDMISLMDREGNMISEPEFTLLDGYDTDE